MNEKTTVARMTRSMGYGKIVSERCTRAIIVDPSSNSTSWRRLLTFVGLTGKYNQTTTVSGGKLVVGEGDAAVLRTLVARVRRDRFSLVDSHQPREKTICGIEM